MKLGTVSHYPGIIQETLLVCGWEQHEIRRNQGPCHTACALMNDTPNAAMSQLTPELLCKLWNALSETHSRKAVQLTSSSTLNENTGQPGRAKCWALWEGKKVMLKSVTWTDSLGPVSRESSTAKRKSFLSFIHSFTQTLRCPLPGMEGTNINGL